MHSSVFFKNALDYLLDLQLILVTAIKQIIIQELKQQQQFCHQQQQLQQQKSQQQQLQKERFLFNKQRRRRLQPWQISIPAPTDIKHNNFNSSKNNNT